jgi:hypothetical protein
MPHPAIAQALGAKRKTRFRFASRKMPWMAFFEAPERSTATAKTGGHPDPQGKPLLITISFFHLRLFAAKSSPAPPQPGVKKSPAEAGL